MPGIKNPRGPGKTAGSCFKEAHHETICIIPRIRYQCKGETRCQVRSKLGLESQKHSTSGFWQKPTAWVSQLMH